MSNIWLITAVKTGIFAVTTTPNVTGPATGRTHAIDAPSPRRTRAIDPQMRPLRWANAVRSREGRLFLALRAELVRHVGGKPTATQRALIDRAAMLQTHLARMDERMFRDGEMSDHAGRQYLAWANSVSRMLQALGLDAADEKPQTPDDILRDIYRQASAGRSGTGQ